MNLVRRLKFSLSFLGIILGLAAQPVVSQAASGTPQGPSPGPGPVDPGPTGPSGPGDRGGGQQRQQLPPISSAPSAQALPVAIAQNNAANAALAHNPNDLALRQAAIAAHSRLGSLGDQFLKDVASQKYDNEQAPALIAMYKAALDASAPGLRSSQGSSSKRAVAAQSGASTTVPNAPKATPPVPTPDEASVQAYLRFQGVPASIENVRQLRRDNPGRYSRLIAEADKFNYLVLTPVQKGETLSIATDPPVARRRPGELKTADTANKHENSEQSGASQIAPPKQLISASSLSPEEREAASEKLKEIEAQLGDQADVVLGDLVTEFGGDADAFVRNLNKLDEKLKLETVSRAGAKTRTLASEASDSEKTGTTPLSPLEKTDPKTSSSTMNGLLSKISGFLVHPVLPVLLLVFAVLVSLFSQHRSKKKKQKTSTNNVVQHETRFCVEVERNGAPRAKTMTDDTNHTLTHDYFKNEFSVFSPPEKKGVYEILGKLPDGTSVGGTLLPGSVASAQTLGWSNQTGNFLLTQGNQWKKAADEPKEKFLFTVKNPATANLLRKKAKTPTIKPKSLGSAVR